MSEFQMAEFPRNLSPFESEHIKWLLPNTAPEYISSLEFIQRSQVIGEGRWGSGDLMLSPFNTPIDHTLGMEAILARGELIYSNDKVSISIHSPNVDDQIEVHFSESSQIVGERPKAKWCFSYWKPGDTCPATNKEVREIEVNDNSGTLRYVLAISIGHRDIWLHNADTSYNLLLPVTAFYTGVLQANHKSVDGTHFTSAQFFDQLKVLTDSELIRGLLHYNQERRKFNAENITFEVRENKGLIATVLSRFKKHG